MPLEHVGPDRLVDVAAVPALIGKAAYGPPELTAAAKEVLKAAPKIRIGCSEFVLMKTVTLAEKEMNR